MIRGPKVGIVGEGVVGLNTGIEALRLGYPVTIYEQPRMIPNLLPIPEN